MRILLIAGLISFSLSANAFCIFCEEEDKPIIDTTYQQVLNDFSKNSLTAEEKYKGKLIRFKARLDSVQSAIGGITVGAFANGRPLVATFKRVAKDDLEQLKQGDVFSLACETTFNGEILDNCLVSK